MDVLMNVSCRGKVRGPMMAMMILLASMISLADANQSTPNTITFDNQSGRNAVVRIMGPTKTIAKMQRDEKRIVHVAAGEYYILVRYGDSAKEYSYTKSSTFSVVQSEGKVSIIRFTLHRRSGGTFNSQPVSGNEFEAGVHSHSASSSP